MRSSSPLATMVRIHQMQYSVSLSDPGMEEPLAVVPTMPRFAGVDLISDKISKETMIFRFRYLLDMNNLGNQIFDIVKARLGYVHCITRPAHCFELSWGQ